MRISTANTHTCPTCGEIEECVPSTENILGGSSYGVHNCYLCGYFWEDDKVSARR